MIQDFYRLVQPVFRKCLVWGLLAGGCLSVQAQWQTQTLTISNGWTSVYLYVDASSQNLLPTTAGLPISPSNPVDQIWLWKAPPNTAQYVSSPANPLNASGYWVSWGQTNQVNTLATLVPNAAYLIHSTAATNYTWNIKGQPVPPSYTWDMTGLNLLGFQTEPGTPPNFQAFLAQAPALADSVQIYEYFGGPFSANNPAQVLFPQNTAVVRGQAFWLAATNVNNTYFGPFNVNLPNPSGLNYGASGGQFTFHLVNQTPNPLTVTMTVLPSETPPAGQSPIVAVPPLLLEGAENVTNLTYAYTALAPAGSGTGTNAVSWTLAPSGKSGSDVPVVLGVNRYAMTNYPGSLYAGILQFTDSLGFSDVNVPVSATAANTAGLWVGSASVSQVGYDLKTYATNSDGSLMLSAVTNQVVTTNMYTFGQFTNLAATYLAVTNTLVDNYKVTNLVINTYTTNTATVVTNGTVITTNTTVYYNVTNLNIIQTEVTGYYYTNDYELLVWITTNIDESPIVNETATATNLVYVTNLITAVPANGTPVTITNTVTDVYSTTSLVVTNAVFESGVTNATYGGYSSSSLSTSVGPANDVYTTNVVSASYTVTTGPSGMGYAVTNLPSIILYPPVTNYFLVSKPLLLVTNGPNLISINVLTNLYLYNNAWTPVVVQNYNVISNNYVLSGGQTNFLGSVTNTVSSVYPGQPQLTAGTNTFISLNITTNIAQILTTNLAVLSVSNYVVTAHNTSLDSVVTPYPLRLIIFNPTNGSPSLLQRVYYGIRQATNVVVATTESVLDPGTLNVDRRITATQLPWTAANTPYPFTGGPLQQGATLTTTVTEAYDDQAANPFLHTYHPDHNNLNFNYSPPHELPQGSQSYTITRVIQLTVAPGSSDFISLTTANSSLVGYYNETITLAGLGGATKSYQTAGTFSLKQLSPIPNLTTQ
jgi:hypothetical protein